MFYRLIFATQFNAIHDSLNETPFQQFSVYNNIKENFSELFHILRVTF